MATIQARCPSCGATVTLVARETSLSMAQPGPLGRVAFTCPDCLHRVALPVDETMAEQLQRHGARLEDDRVTDREPEQPRRAEGPPIGYDDVLDFHLLLRRDDWFDRLRELVR